MRYFPPENLICACGPESLMFLNSANFYRKPLVKNNLVGKNNKRNKNLTPRATEKNFRSLLRK